MSDGQLINFLTGLGIPVLGLLLGFFYWQMNRSDARRREEQAEDAREAAATALVKQRYLLLREQVQGLINRYIRRFENIRNKAEQGKDTEVIKLAEEAIAELEKVELPPLE